MNYLAVVLLFFMLGVNQSASRQEQITVLHQGVTLTWNASTSTVVGYNVYRGTTKGGPYVKLNSALVTKLTYTDTKVSGQMMYYYVTTAVDGTNKESKYSNEAQVQIP